MPFDYKSRRIKAKWQYLLNNDLVFSVIGVIVERCLAVSGGKLSFNEGDEADDPSLEELSFLVGSVN